MNIMVLETYKAFANQLWSIENSFKMNSKTIVNDNRIKRKLTVRHSQANAIIWYVHQTIGNIISIRTLGQLVYGRDMIWHKHTAN